MQVNANRDTPKRNKHSTKSGPGRRHAQGDGTKKTTKQKSAGAYSRGLQNAWNRKRQLRMAKLHPLRDEHGAITLTGGCQDYIEIGPYGDFCDASPGPRRIWLAGISAQRGY